MENKCIEITEQTQEYSFCEYWENIGSNSNKIYSCRECISLRYILAIKSNGARICVNPLLYPELHNCGIVSKANNDQNGYICSSCYYGTSSSNPLLKFVYDESLQKDICKCKEGYYDDSLIDYNEQYTSDGVCRLCCYLISNYYCEELAKEEGSLNNECVKYREPYFLNKTNSIPESCLDYFDHCSKCSYVNIESSELKCDNCLDNYYLNKNGVCEHCYINTNESPYCISCTDNEDLKKISPCQKCIKDYFLTKENKCILCKSENYGGKYCNKCDYITIDGVEKIGCIECDYNSWAEILPDGKCFKSNEDEDKCDKYGYYFNKNDEKKFGCIECQDEYNLNEDHQCIKITIYNCMQVKLINGEQICTECYSGYQLVDNKCKIIQNTINSIIEGCSSYYSGKDNTKYCIKMIIIIFHIMLIQY